MRVLVTLSNNELSYAEIELAGIFPLAARSLVNPEDIYNELERGPDGSLQTIFIFKGIVEFDSAFQNHIGAQILKVIAKALHLAEPTVHEELAWKEKVAQSKNGFNIRTIARKNIIINHL